MIERYKIDNNYLIRPDKQRCLTNRDLINHFVIAESITPIVRLDDYEDEDDTFDIDRLLRIALEYESVVISPLREKYKGCGSISGRGGIIFYSTSCDKLVKYTYKS